MFVKGILFFLLSIKGLLPLYAWNAQGHRLISHLAYEGLTPQTKKSLAYYLTAQNDLSLRAFENASLWLDKPKQKRNVFLRKSHYIDWPISFEGYAPTIRPTHNALEALNQAKLIIKSKTASRRQKAKALKIFIHVYQDIHQPLHTTSAFSRQFPLGDKGGNLVTLKQVKGLRNLHAYWDNAAGLLKAPRRDPAKWQAALFQKLNAYQSCPASKTIPTFHHTISESHMLGMTFVYGHLPKDKVIQHTYREQAQKIATQQLLIAACRLSSALNQLLDVKVLE